MRTPKVVVVCLSAWPERERKDRLSADVEREYAAGWVLRSSCPCGSFLYLVFDKEVADD